MKGSREFLSLSREVSRALGFFFLEKNCLHNSIFFFYFAQFDCCAIFERYDEQLVRASLDHQNEMLFFANGISGFFFDFSRPVPACSRASLRTRAFSHSPACYIIRVTNPEPMTELRIVMNGLVMRRQPVSCLSPILFGGTIWHPRKSITISVCEYDRQCTREYACIYRFTACAPSFYICLHNFSHLFVEMCKYICVCTSPIAQI